MGEWTEDGIEFAGRVYEESEVTVLPPTDPRMVIAVGRNNRERVEHIGAEIPDRPRLFFKPPHTLVGHGGTVTLPPDAADVVFEAELGVVVGEQCRNVPEEEVEEVIAGYTCVNDVSNLDAADYDPGYLRIKGFESACPVGPVVVPPEDVPDDAHIELRVNGEPRQDSTVEHHVFSPAEAIAEITAYLTLHPGDVISMGTPPGIAPLEHGDTVEIEIEGSAPSDTACDGRAGSPTYRRPTISLLPQESGNERPSRREPVEN